mmetsp:Transcript_53833/g.125823  ORF Transcript_53833/g.125823 Transcript_53833/m.125823 type:complete len:308 (-) Transcript_53833:525-1448(-)
MCTLFAPRGEGVLRVRRVQRVGVGDDLNLLAVDPRFLRRVRVGRHRLQVLQRRHVFVSVQLLQPRAVHALWLLADLRQAVAVADRRKLPILLAWPAGAAIAVEAPVAVVGQRHRDCPVTDARAQVRPSHRVAALSASLVAAASLVVVLLGRKHLLDCHCRPAVLSLEDQPKRSPSQHVWGLLELEVGELDPPVGLVLFFPLDGIDAAAAEQQRQHRQRDRDRNHPQLDTLGVDVVDVGLAHTLAGPVRLPQRVLPVLCEAVAGHDLEEHRRLADLAAIDEELDDVHADCVDFDVCLVRVVAQVQSRA